MVYNLEQLRVHHPLTLQPSSEMKLSNSLKRLFLAVSLVATVMAAPTPAPPSGVYKLCVPEIYLDECNKMVTEMDANDVHISCVVARDRLDCLDKIKSHQADFGPVDPEDLYIASRIPNQDFNLFKEIRTKEEPTEEFRYEAVAVIHKNLQIDNIQGLRGLKSCHTGINRNVGYKIPITKLTKMGILSIPSDETITTQESELRALSQFFGKACLVGKWSKDADLNRRLKSTYSNLCELCENPAVCDYPDKYSGYDGALRCLSENGGEVAWTKVYYVKKHFGLGGWEATGINPDEYAYLCPDGSKVPMSAKPACTWARRPWQGYLTTGENAGSVPALRNVIAQANTVGESTHADWLKILALDNKTVAVDNNQPQSPQGYLDKANYTDVIERNWGSANPIRFCVTSDDELNKCRDLARAAWSRDVRPGFNCVLQASVQDCLRIIKENGADVITITDNDLVSAQREFDLKPIMYERYNDNLRNFAVAVVKKSSSYQSLADLRGAKSCHTGFARTAGWSVPLYSLVRKSLSSCPHAVSKFFSGGSCVPGALNPQDNTTQGNPESLCSICAGDLTQTDPAKQVETKCSRGGSKESFYCHGGAFRCLASGSGDVAFVGQNAVADNTDGKNQASWAADLHSTDFELLCPEGGRASVDQYERCNLMQLFGRMVVTRKSSSDNEVNSIRHGLLAATDLYEKRPELFKLFGKYNEKSDLLFKDKTKGLVSMDRDLVPVLQKYTDMLDVVKSCSTAHA